MGWLGSVPVRIEKWSLLVAFEEIKAEIATLLAELTERPHDRRQFEIMLRERLAELKAFGMPLPDDLAEFEAALDQQLAGEARERTRYPARRHRE